MLKAVRIPAAALALGAAAPLAAQGRPRLDITLPPPAYVAMEGPLVSAQNMLLDEHIRELLLAGFPARFHFRIELWSEGFLFNTMEQAADYDIYARYTPLDRQFEVILLAGERPQLQGKFPRLEAADSAVARPFRVPFQPKRRSRSLYYQATLGVEVLQASDLDEVERWLKGLEPGLTGRENPAGALSRGIKALFVRLLGGEKREYEGRSETFTLPP